MIEWFIFSFLPFSTGRRVCVGEAVAKVELHLLTALLFQRYTFAPPEGEELKIETIPGLQCVPKPYKVVATLREWGGVLGDSGDHYSALKTNGNNDNYMMTSSNEKKIRITGLLCGEFTGHRWIPPHKGQERGALIISLFCAWINVWVNNEEAGDFRRHRAHYDVIAMYIGRNAYGGLRTSYLDTVVRQASSARFLCGVVGHMTTASDNTKI